MKYLYFIQWQWKKFNLTEKLFWLGLLFVIIGVISGITSIPWIGDILIYAGMTIFVVVFTKWFVWEVLKKSFLEYENEQKGIIEILKDKNDNVLQNKK